jgi:RHS repeat-associated protein
LEEYDYGARFYDPQIGRFGTQDKFAEKYDPLTPYQYGANNPIRYVDMNGDWKSIDKRNES